jgi:hypothetical protein
MLRSSFLVSLMIATTPAVWTDFLVAHEAGHNLNLRHAMDNERMPGDVPNLMGDGPYEQCVGPGGSTDYQAGQIRKSRLVQKRILCLDVKAAGHAIVDESFEPYFSQLQRAEIAALTAAAPTDETLDGCRREAQQRFQDAVRPFADREAEALTFLVEQLESRVRAEYPLLARQPWRFIKTADHLCGGFSWTRGLCIVFSERTVERITTARNSMPAADFVKQHGPLLLHEQMHVLQRVYPSRFAKLYTDGFGFSQATVEPHPWLTERQMTNPDAVRLEWVFAIGGDDGPQKYIWPRTILKTTEGVPRMGWDFRMLAVEVQKVGATWHVKSQADGTPTFDPAASALMARRFSVRNALDHPNEIAAYMFPKLVFAETDNRRELTEMQQQLADWCSDNLR